MTTVDGSVELPSAGHAGVIGSITVSKLFGKRSGSSPTVSGEYISGCGYTYVDGMTADGRIRLRGYMGRPTGDYESDSSSIHNTSEISIDRTDVIQDLLDDMGVSCDLDDGVALDISIGGGDDIIPQDIIIATCTVSGGSLTVQSVRTLRGSSVMSFRTYSSGSNNTFYARIIGVTPLDGGGDKPILIQMADGETVPPQATTPGLDLLAGVAA